MIMLLLLAAVGAGCYWLGRNSRFHPPAEAEHLPARREALQDPAPAWPWVAGAAVLGILLLGMAAAPPGIFGGPSVFAGVFGP